MEKVGEKAVLPDKGFAALAVLYGCGVGAGIVSYLARSGLITFTYRPPFAGSVTIVDVLGYPKQQEIFWYIVGLAIPLLMGLIYGYISRARQAAPLLTEIAWWISLIIFIAQSPLLALSAWPGNPIAILHLSLLALTPAAVGFIIRRIAPVSPQGDGACESPPASRGHDDRWNWASLLLLAIFAGFVSNEFLTMSDISKLDLELKPILWAGVIGMIYFALFKHLSRYIHDGKISNVDRAVFGMMPVVFLPLYQLVWGHYWVYGAMFLAALLVGAMLYIRPPGMNAGRLAMYMLPLGISMALQLNPQYRFAEIDVIHEGQQLAFAQCVLRGMLPGVEKAVKYGPLYELTEGWTMKLFGAQVSVLRMYFLWAQTLGYWFGCLLLAEFVKRRWAIVYGWMGYLGFSIAALYGTGRYNGLRAGWPILAIFLWSRRCRGGGKGWLISAGAVGAVGGLYSVEFGLAGTVALLAGLVSRGFGQGLKSGVYTVLRESAIMAAGALIIVIPFMLLYIARGGLLSLLSGMFEYAQAFSMGYGAFPFPEFPWLDSDSMKYLGFGYFIKHIQFHFVPLVCVAFGGWLLGKFISRKWSPELAGMVALWVYAIAGFRSTMGRSDFFHLLQAEAPAIILLYVIIDRLAGALKTVGSRGRILKRVGMPVIVVILSILLVSPLINFEYVRIPFIYYMEFRMQKDIPQIEAFYYRQDYAPLRLDRAREIWTPIYQVALLTQDTEFIQRNTAWNKPLHIASLAGLFFFLSDRIPLTRYCMTLDAVTPQTRRQMVDKLATAKPRVIFLEMGPRQDFDYEDEHPDEIRYIGEHYVFQQQAGDLVAYVRRPGMDNE